MGPAVLLSVLSAAVILQLWITKILPQAFQHILHVWLVNCGDTRGQCDLLSQRPVGGISQGHKIGEAPSYRLQQDPTCPLVPPVNSAVNTLTTGVFVGTPF